MILVTAPKLQEDRLGTNTISYCSLSLLVDIPLLGAAGIARGFIKYKGEKGNFNSSHLYLLIHTSNLI